MTGETERRTVLKAGAAIVGATMLPGGAQAQGAVARIVGTYRRKQDLVAAARRAVGADLCGAAAEIAGVRLEPADAVVDVLQ